MLSACSDSASRNISRRPLRCMRARVSHSPQQTQHKLSFLRAAQTEPCLASSVRFRIGSKYEHLKYSYFLHTFACLELRRCIRVWPPKVPSRVCSQRYRGLGPVGASGALAPRYSVPDRLSLTVFTRSHVPSLQTVTSLSEPTETTDRRLLTCS
jgi:hypothetical protein